MCEIYVKADPMLYESRARSIRIHGFVTKIRLENLFWDILAELAGNEGMTTNQLIAKLYDEIEVYRGEVENFASFLRVTCLRYLTLRHQKTGERPSLAVVGTLPPAIRELPRSVGNA
ncbi:ribbon-helix-helix domain-containing protein [Ferribacterium limneticum]|uniref:ribbon-helix-helix domain-containing protein n=1 Tax=Ferribacterium limneticum TaxID=76259 RepID=UPI001CFB3F5C|nr:ribbon-helix-helix domain-containing protein [Ferribacterium limneticum]UCV28564.1 ribbon-helix-helix domain-containing protein [Ferribacterium limneticum]UCV32481.1 ribbon-helix-helix domain-containing protein [Ferribacterium limneticum]